MFLPLYYTNVSTLSLPGLGSFTYICSSSQVSVRSLRALRCIHNSKNGGLGCGACFCSACFPVTYRAGLPHMSGLWPASCCYNHAAGRALLCVILHRLRVWEMACRLGHQQLGPGAGISFPPTEKHITESRATGCCQSWSFTYLVSEQWHLHSLILNWLILHTFFIHIIPNWALPEYTESGKPLSSATSPVCSHPTLEVNLCLSPLFPSRDT